MQLHYTIQDGQVWVAADRDSVQIELRTILGSETGWFGGGQRSFGLRGVNSRKHHSWRFIKWLDGDKKRWVPGRYKLNFPVLFAWSGNSVKRHHRQRLRHFVTDVVVHTPFVRMVLLLVGLWLVFGAGMYLAERGADESGIDSVGAALYWGVAAFSTAGIADTPVTGTAQLIGGMWIVIGSVLFFGTIVATVTAYFMRPLQRPVKQIIETIEYNLERMDDLSVEELELLKRTADGLIEHMERIKATHAVRSRAGTP